MINRKLVAFTITILFASLFIPLASAQGDWNISSDWDTGGYPTASPSPNPMYVKTANSAVNNSYTALGLVSISMFILAAVLIMGSIRNEDGDAKSMFAGIVVIIATVILLIVGIALINSFSATLVL